MGDASQASTSLGLPPRPVCVNSRRGCPAPTASAQEPGQGEGSREPSAPACPNLRAITTHKGHILLPNRPRSFGKQASTPAGLWPLR